MVGDAGGCCLVDLAGSSNVALEVDMKSEHQRKEQLIIKLRAVVPHHRRLFGPQESGETFAQKPSGFGRSVR
jgi:hypothetical protein